MKQLLAKIQIKHLLLLAFLLYLPLTFLGYGSDVDSYRVITAGRSFWQSADYVPSRRPVFIVHEMMTFLLDQIGGSLLSNLGTLALSLLALYSFYRICQHYRIPHALLLTTILIVQPVYWVNSTCSIDYVWAMGFLLAGFWLMTEEKPLFAGVAFGLAAGSRLTSVLAIAGILLLFFLKGKHMRKNALIAGFISVFLTAAALYLPLDFAGFRANFWGLSTGADELWTPTMRLGRFAYKNIYFWGLPTVLLLAVLLVFVLKGSRNFKGTQMAIGLLSLWVIVSHQILFLRYPIELEYLLPTLPFWLILLGIGLSGRKQMLVILLVCVLFSNFVDINIAQPDTPSAASDATFGVWLEKGYTLEDLHWRTQLTGCEDSDCYSSRIPPNSR